MPTPPHQLISRLLHAVLIALLASPILARPTLAGPLTTERVSINSAGQEGDRASRMPSVTGDGRMVVFASEATNLAPEDANGAQDIFLHDWSTGITQRVSLDPQGGDPNAASAWPKISADGSTIAFASEASNLVPGDNNGQEDVFVLDLGSGEIELISVSNAGAQGNAPSSEPVVSGDGRYVAFVSSATNLFSGATSGYQEVFLRDRSTGMLQWVSRPLSGTNNNEVSGEIAISQDGNWVAFSSISTNLVSNDTNGFRDVFLWRRSSGALLRISVTPAGTQANSLSFTPTLSADGRFVGFRSHASNLVPDDTNFLGDIFRLDRQTGQILRASVTSSGQQSLNGPSDEPVISADGRFIAFKSYASDLVPNDDNSRADIFLRDMQGATTLVSMDSAGGQSNGNNYSPAMSEDGAAIAFYSEADNLDLVLVDNNDSGDVFAHGDPPQPEPTATPTETPTLDPTATTEPTSTLEPSPTPTVEPSPTITLVPTYTATPVPTTLPPTYTATPVPTDPPTAVPTYTATSIPTEAYTPTAVPPTATAEPTQTGVCSWTLDFETDAAGRPLALGQLIDNEWSSIGIHITTSSPGAHPAMIFDSAHPTGADQDLGSPNEDFGGPGRGSGGAEGQPGENRLPLGRVLILSQDGNSSAPNDYAAGGTFIFTFDTPRKVDKVQILDIDAHEVSGKVTAYDQAGSKLGSYSLQPLGSNSVQVVNVGLANVSRLEIQLQNSGAVAALSFCDPDPRPDPTAPPPTEPPPTEPPAEPTSTPSAPPTTGAAPVIELKSEASLNEGGELSLSGTFVDPDSTRWEASVDYGDGDGFVSLALNDKRGFKLSRRYGDDGEYRVTVRVKDESGAYGEAFLLVKVKNKNPILEGDALNALANCDKEVREAGRSHGRSACQVGDWYVATAGQPTVFTFDLEDPGSDDLGVRWSFGDEATYFNAGGQPDPENSPRGTYPFRITHSASYVFDKPGVKYVTIEVKDDDGGQISKKLKVLVRGAESCRTSLGYWIQRFKKDGFSIYSGELRAHLSILSAFVTSSFGEFSPEMIDRLEQFVLTDNGESAQARAQLITAWLNFTNGSVDWDEAIDGADGRHDLDYAGVLREILAILLESNSSDKDLKHAIELAESVNLHRRGSSCPAYDE